MSMKSNLLGAVCLSFAAVSLALAPAQAQDAWPQKRISLTIGFASGGFADSVARIIGAKLSDRLGQQVVMQNMDGAGGNIAARHVASTAPDGYTVLVTTTSLAINDTLYKTKGFSAKGLTPVALPVSAPESFASNPKSNIKTLGDLLAQAKAGETVFLGTPGIGSGSHLAAEYFFKVLAKANVKHIPFPGGAPAKLGLLAGDVSVLSSTATAATIPAMVNKEVLGLAVASAERDPAIPDVPTFAELGFPGFLASSWAGFFVPDGTPDAVQAKLNAEINAALKDPEVKAKIDAMGLIIANRTPAETQAYFKSEIGNWAKMVEAAGVAVP
jgi:tripartite-type tricarboxylate transporter receptor subunit TctC